MLQWDNSMHGVFGLVSYHAVLCHVIVVVFLNYESNVIGYIEEKNLISITWIVKTLFLWNSFNLHVYESWQS